MINQVSYEYIACQQERQGAMILSEFAGAAQSLNGSIVVNPWDSQQVADAIHEAVTMSPETRSENHKKLFKVSPSFISQVPISHIVSSTSTSIRPHTGEPRLSAKCRASSPCSRVLRHQTSRVKEALTLTARVRRWNMGPLRREGDG